MKLVEEYAGVGDLSGRGEVLHGRCATGLPGIRRSPPATGCRFRPAPDRRRDRLPPNEDVDGSRGPPLVLRLEDGRTLGVTLADTPAGCCPRATVPRDVCVADFWKPASVFVADMFLHVTVIGLQLLFPCPGPFLPNGVEVGLPDRR